uniref:Uncharacterized protein n=1 Tax=Cyanistes caeruleus TaxID=156563 RepID=A0A8C0U140_CYACU
MAPGLDQEWCGQQDQGRDSSPCRLRPFSCELGLLSRPDGSATFLQGLWGSPSHYPIPSRHPMLQGLWGSAN